MVRRIALWLSWLAAAIGCPAAGWGQSPWPEFAHGEYIGPSRIAHVPEYLLRVDDQLQFTYCLSREQLAQGYPLEVGDVLRVESVVDANLNRELTVQPDGTIDLLLLGPIGAARRTVEEIQKDLNQQYKRFYKVTDIHVTRVKTQAQLVALRAAAERQLEAEGAGRIRVTPAGTISLPSIGQVQAQGLTLDELAREINARYRELVTGLEVTPILAERAPRQVYVLGDVQRPGRYDLRGPTTVLQSIALAGGWFPGSRPAPVVVLRRTDDWRLMATRLDMATGPDGACPWADEIWIRDSDVVIVSHSSGHWCGHLGKHLFGRASACEPVAVPSVIEGKVSGEW